MRERRKTTKQSIAGSLLLAHPAMKDPNFRRSVVLMSAHNAEGAMGVVMNRPLGKRLGELNGEFALGALAGVPVFTGGPVQPKQLLLVAWQDRADGFQLHFGIEPDKAAQLLARRARSCGPISAIRAGRGDTDLGDTGGAVRNVVGICASQSPAM